MDFFSKLGLVVKGNAHDLLEKAINMNSIPVLKQTVREFESAISNVKRESINQSAAVLSLQREIKTKQAEVDKALSTAQAIKDGNSPNKDVLLQSQGTVVISGRKAVETLNANLVEQQNLATQLSTRVTQLEAKHTVILNRIHELERLDNQTKAKEQTTKAVNQVSNILADGIDGSSIDNLESSIRERNDRASVGFDQAMGTLDQPADPAQSVEMDSFLSELK